MELADLLSFTENSFWVVLNKWSAWKFRGGTGNWGEVSERLTSDRPSGYRTSDMRQQNRQTSVIRQVKSVMKEPTSDNTTYKCLTGQFEDLTSESKIGKYIES